MNTTTYNRITERIIGLLEKGTVPWHKPWQAKSGWPRNYVSKKPYRGINVFLLHAMSYESPYWLTFLQVTELGGIVRKGEKSCPIVFWKKQETKDEATGEVKTTPLLRIYNVFNVAQCEGLNNIPAVATDTSFGPPTKPEEMVAFMPKRPEIKHGMRKAFYAPTEDIVAMPDRERFENEAGYYATLFHELIHSTGHESRLKRASIMEGNGYGSDPYCKEELIAEMGAAFLCGHAGISERTIDNSAAYLNGWLEQLRHDRTLIVHAAAQAQKAADFILGCSGDENPETVHS